MDINILEQHEYVKHEIKDLENRIEKLEEEARNLYVGDSVSGSMNCFPYVKKSFVINGYEDLDNNKYSKKIQKYQNLLDCKKEELIDIKIEIEEYLKNVESSRIRLILRYKYIDNYSWIQIGQKMNMASDTVRMEIKRFLKKI